MSQFPHLLFLVLYLDYKVFGEETVFWFCVCILCSSVGSQCMTGDPRCYGNTNNNNKIKLYYTIKNGKARGMILS